MLEIGVQSHNVVSDDNPEIGFRMLADAGFSCCDFSLNMYLKNTDLYQHRVNSFFDRSVDELTDFFSLHKKAAVDCGIRINQMHMPYPIFIPDASDEINNYLINEMAIKSLHLCDFFGCGNIVVHGLRAKMYYGSEENEWKKTESTLDNILPLAKDLGITICLENIYTSAGGHIIEGPCGNPVKMAERIDKINDRYGSEVVGYCFDTGHANLVGVDFERFLCILGKRVKVLHIHDNDGISDLHQMPFTFTKTRENHPSTDWDGFIRGLKEIEFDGVLSFETAPVLNSFPLELKEEALHMIACIGKYFERRLL